MKDLTGTWKCNGDGMTYTIKQIGNTIYLNGIGNGCTNVGTGVVNLEDNGIILQWADVVGSRGAGNHGICYLDASKDGVITKKAGSPSFAIGNFVKA